MLLQEEALRKEFLETRSKLKHKLKTAEEETADDLEEGDISNIFEELFQ